MSSITNHEIITRARIELLEAGKIGTTGRIIVVELPDGEKRSFPEPEEIHTYQHWKALGYQVRKGEKAITELMIWKYSQRKTSAEETEEETSGKSGKCFMKKSYFFAACQVDRIGKMVA